MTNLPPDFDAVAKLRDKYSDNYLLKFCDHEKFLPVARSLPVQLGLRGRKRCKVLDLGCGFGYFVLACNELGHAAVGMDVDDPLLVEASDILGIQVIRHRIRAREPLPFGPAPWHAVTMHGVNLETDGQWWTFEDYLFLVNDVLDHLAPCGFFQVSWNRGPETEAVMGNPRWFDVLEDRARVVLNDNRAWFSRPCSETKK